MAGAGPALALKAPAKLNLGLRITGRRPDGYHELESVFLPLDLADDVFVELAPEPGVRLAVEGPVAAPAGEENLAYRAARAFLAGAGLEDQGVALRLTKRIPSPGGLGGGSSDAGTVLRALGQLLPGVLGEEALASLALGLGADVPYFLAPRPAWVSGIGERIAPLESFPPLCLVLVHPGKSLATPDVFAAFDAAPVSLTAPDPRPTIRRLSTPREQGGPARTAALAGLSGEDWWSLTANDLEPAATRLCPEVAELREELEATQALAVGMSGSGPTLYGVHAGVDAARDAAARLAARLAGRGARTWVARTTP